MHDSSDEGLETIIARLRAPVPGQEAAARRVATVVASRIGVARPWWRRPALAVRAAGLTALAAAAGLLIVVIRRDGIISSDADPGAPREGAAEAHPAMTSTASAVAFTFESADAHTVSLIGDFNEWNPADAPLVRGADGTWRTVRPLPPGRHEYAFMVDGARWAADPRAPLAETSDYGQPASVLFVGERTP